QRKRSHMRIRPGILITIGILFAVLFGGRYLGWFGKPPNPGAPTPDQPPTQVSVVPEPAPSTPPPALPTGALPAPRPVTARSTLPAASPTPLPPPTEATVAADGVLTNWEEKIDAVLTGKED